LAETLRLPKRSLQANHDFHPGNTPRLPCVADEQKQKATGAIFTRSSIYPDLKYETTALTNHYSRRLFSAPSPAASLHLSGT
jgi:hypothetical protein